MVEEYFVKRIEVMPKEPKTCASCGKTNWAVNVVHDKIGNGKTYICLDPTCQTLNIVTRFQRDRIALTAAEGKKVTLLNSS